MAASILLAPAVTLTIVFLVVPLAYAMFLSLHGHRVTGGGLGVRQQVFVGASNLTAAVTDPNLIGGVQNLLLLGALTVPPTLVGALVLALLLDLPRVRLTRLTRTLIFIPFAVPGVIASLMWGFMYLPAVSPVGDAATAVGLPPPSFLDSSSIFGSLANIGVWGALGFNMIILYSALRGIPGEIYDAARIDGCGEPAIALRIKIPLIVPGLVLTGLFSLIGTLQVFSEPTTLANFTNTITSTWVPMMTVYRDAFLLSNPYSASAMALIVATVTFVASLLLLRIMQQRAFREGK